MGVLPSIFDRALGTAVGRTSLIGTPCENKTRGSRQNSREPSEHPASQALERPPFPAPNCRPVSLRGESRTIGCGATSYLQTRKSAVCPDGWQRAPRSGGALLWGCCTALASQPLRGTLPTPRQALVHKGLGSPAGSALG